MEQRHPQGATRSPWLYTLWPDVGGCRDRGGWEAVERPLAGVLVVFPAARRTHAMDRAPMFVHYPP
ncbi:MAG TPA: hypothetical protein VFQ30_04035 [Ktedonobacteraceae bacterium]|nr:hypothetical protein [Ktedonobacteraceae bacterium]